MHTKFHKFWLVGLLVIVSMLANASGAAAFPEPPDGPQPVQPRGGSGAGVAVTQGAEPNAQAIALGKPGTVFSYNSAFGEADVPYFDSPTLDDPILYLNRPFGLRYNAAGELFITEEDGARLSMLETDGTPVVLAGRPGMHDWGNFGMNWPKDVAVDANGLLWVPNNEVITVVDPNAPEGERVVAQVPPEPWMEPNESRLNEAMGLAFDGTRLFVSDRGRNCVKVFDADINNFTTTWLYDIGVCDEWGDASQTERFNRQAHVEFYDGVLYVADSDNNRVMACEEDPADTFTCSVFHGTGNPGGEDNELSRPNGLGLEFSPNPYLLIADSDNGRVARCNLSGGPMTCDPDFITVYGWPAIDVAYDAVSGTYAVSDGEKIRRFPATGGGDADYTVIAGDPNGKPYLTDDAHFYGVRGIDTDSKNNVYFAEELGGRMFKFDALGNLVWKFGVRSDDPTVGLNGPMSLAVSRTGLVYVGQNSWNRLLVYSAVDGSFVRRIDQDWDTGAEDYHLTGVSGLAVDPRGYVYVADRWRHRVMVYDRFDQKVMELGVMDEPGQDSGHFAEPGGIAVDAKLNIYVADSNNCRVQKFNKYGVYQMTIGSQMCGPDGFDSLGKPIDVAVDAKGRIYVADEWHVRTQVFDKTGAYLTTIGGNWGSGTSQFRSASGVAVDKKGNVYIGDWSTAQVKKFLPKAPDYFGQLTLNGFGSRWTNAVTAVTMYKGLLYAGVESDRGAQIWRKGKKGWEVVEADGFRNGNNGIDHLFEFNGMLYASTYNYDPNSGGQIWRTMDGLTWQIVVNNGFDQGQRNPEVFRMMKLDNQLCATTWSNNSGSQLWCSPSGDLGSWVQEDLGGDGFGQSDNIAISDVIEYQGGWYAATFHANYDDDGDGNPDDLDADADGGQVWLRGKNGIWTQVNENGFGVPENVFISSLVPFTGGLYAMAVHGPGESSQIWRCKGKCDKAADWEFVTDGETLGGDWNYRRGAGLVLVGTRLVAVMGNNDLGLGVFTTLDGNTWAQVGLPGMGNSNNQLTYYANSLYPYKGNLYMGVFNRGTGGSVWKFCPTKKVCK